MPSRLVCSRMRIRVMGLFYELQRAVPLTNMIYHDPNTLFQLSFHHLSCIDPAVYSKTFLVVFHAHGPFTPANGFPDNLNAIFLHRSQVQL